ncbi:MAG: CoA ester lyase [Chloroflexi bacterium]|nr:CoA ester lyase [Chloroflexota bacterium]
MNHKPSETPILRSLLFVPGNRTKMLDKALGLSPDAFVLDMEDSVPAAEKPNARKAVASYLKKLTATGATVIPRVNAVGSEFIEEDLAAVVGPHIFGVSVGKISSPDDVNAVSDILWRLETKAKIPEGATRLVLWLETASAVVHAYQIASASPRVAAVAFGAEDLTNDMAIERTDDDSQFDYARNAIATAAVAAGVPALDTPFFRLGDLEGLREECLLGKRCGFRGKFAIHPEQIATINEMYSPSPAEIEQAQRVVDAFREAESQGHGSLSLDGRVVDVPVVRRAEKLLALAQRASGKGK